MARLIAKSPLDGVLPVDVGGTEVSEAIIETATAIAPFAGRESAVAKLLEADLALGFPAPNSTLSKGKARILWWGRGQAQLVGAAPPKAMAGLAALTDQSDGLAALRLSGDLAEPALARLVPLDLSDEAFPVGATARTLLFHMTCSVTRLGATAFELLVMRSMGRTAAHDLTIALRRVAARTP